MILVVDATKILFFPFLVLACPGIMCLAFGQYAILLVFSYTLLFTFAANASNIFKIVLNRASVLLFSILEI